VLVLFLILGMLSFPICSHLFLNRNLVGGILSGFTGIFFLSLLNMEVWLIVFLVVGGIAFYAMLIMWVQAYWGETEQDRLEGKKGIVNGMKLLGVVGCSLTVIMEYQCL